jgi:predicted alternative tryptophan synthase beta-subunit
MAKPINKDYFVTLPIDETPTSWYNIQADLPEPLPPPLDPETKEPINPEKLFRIFGKELVMQEMAQERYVKIPDEVYDAYIRLPRPPPCTGHAGLRSSWEPQLKFTSSVSSLSSGKPPKPTLPSPKHTTT